MRKEARIYVAGHDTMIGAGLVRELRSQGHMHLVGASGDAPDVTDSSQVDDFFAENKPEYVFVAAGKSGGIRLNQERGAELMEHNLGVVMTLLPAARRHGVTKLLYLASSCVYPRDCKQPMSESDLMTGPLEPTNEPYALAKLAGLKLCGAYRQQHGVNFVVAIPTNVFGPGDAFHSENSHVIASLMRRMDEARRTGAASIDVWGSGNPRREFIPVADLARACIAVMDRYDDDAPINLGNGHAMTIAELAAAIKKVVGFEGELRFDTSRPDGMPEKVLDSSKLRALGWEPSIAFESALEETHAWYLEHIAGSGAVPHVA